MNDLVEKDPAIVDPQPVAEEEDERSTFMVVAQFFIIPGAIIAVCVGLFLLFGLLTGESRNASDYLSEIRSGSKTRRYQAAYELSTMLTYDQDLAREPGFVPELARIFAESEGKEPELRRYLALALGRVADSRGVTALVGGLADPDAQTRVYTLWALGAIGDVRAVGPIIESLTDPDPDVRKMAAHTLGSLQDPAAIPALEGALDDSISDVQWNAALALGQLGDAAALPVLQRMLDRQYLDRVEGITPPQKTAAMVNAVRALALLGGPEAVELLTRLSAAEDSDIEVRSAALEAVALLRRPPE